MLRKPIQALLVLVAFCHTAAAKPVEGVDYELMPPPAQTSAPAAKTPVTVVYYFSHYCPTCANIAVPVDRWFAALPPDVVSQRVIVPILSQAGKEPTNETYQVLRQLGVLPQVDSKLFAHLSRGRGSLQDRPALLAWLGKEGVPVESFEKASKSFTVASQTARAQAALRRVMQLEKAEIPMFIVDDRYRVPFSAISEVEKKLATLDALVARARAERGIK